MDVQTSVRQNLSEKWNSRTWAGLPYVGKVSLSGNDVNRHLSGLGAYDDLLVCVVTAGTARVMVNYKTYELSDGVLFLLYPGRLYRWEECSSEFKAECLSVSREFMEEMDSVDMVSRRVKYGVRLYGSPVCRPTPEQSRRLLVRMDRLEEAKGMTSHLYYKEMVVGNLNLFYLDLSDVIDCELEAALRKDDPGRTRRDALIENFIGLLTRHFRECHTVDFYARSLHLSEHYLTLTVKKITGQSVSALVYALLYAEACLLLSSSHLSVGEIALRLNFSDQSAFRKFFKSRSGLSPLDYRKTHS